MAFLKQQFECVNSGAANAPRIWSYKNHNDTLMTMLSAGYFNEVGYRLDNYDMIYLVAEDGPSQVVVTSADSANVVVVSVFGSNGGGLTYSTVLTTSRVATGNTGLIIGNSNQTTIMLPLAAFAGTMVAICGYGAGGWILQCNTGQTIQIGTTPTSIGGSVMSSNRWDQIQVICLVDSGAVWSLYGAVTSAYTIT